MNRKGQTLIIFVILLPIIFAFGAFIIDIGIITHEELKLSKITNLALENCSLKETKEENVLKIKEILEKNKIDIENLEVTQTDSVIRIQNAYQIKSTFGALIGIKEYSIKIDKKIKEKE